MHSFPLTPYADYRAIDWIVFLVELSLEHLGGYLPHYLSYCK